MSWREKSSMRNVWKLRALWSFCMLQTLYDWFQSTQNKLTSIDSQFVSVTLINLIDVIISDSAASSLSSLPSLSSSSSFSSFADCMILNSNEDNDDDDNDDDNTAAQQLQKKFILWEQTENSIEIL